MELNKVLKNTQEQFPRIYEAIEMLWGHPELQMYLSKLVLNDRDYLRSGFPPEVVSELLALHVKPFNGDIWQLNCH